MWWMTLSRGQFWSFNTELQGILTFDIGDFEVAIMEGKAQIFNTKQ